MTYRLFSLILAGLLALPCADAGAEALEPGQHAAEAAKESFRAKRAEAAGVAAIAVHGRTREQYYKGHADWSMIAAVKQAVKIPVIANGDIRTTADLARVFRETGCDGVMIGRAAQGNPWIFRAFRSFLETGVEPPSPTIAERGALILRHLDMLIQYKGDYIGAREMRKHATWYTKGMTGGGGLREAFNHAETREDFQRIVEKMIKNAGVNEDG